ncbi:PspC domain-containing protein [Pedobacter sandarakinus]|uniref:PspC domain-containing protein n=1 Tax=Pedobacter sandarakinus TaxID=353156 RepID=UPI002247E749|nr:PspC domain-containing protein [Pedobacter sandarakinus]MCX2575795.1 PspC domain-containing protein [Pedobacter sandarakinus]
MEKKLFRNEHDKMIAGVASGLADYLQVEVTIVRLLFVLSAFFMAGGGLIAYIIMWIIVPVNQDPEARFSKFNDYFSKHNPNTNSFGSSGGFGGPTGSGQSNWTQPMNENTNKAPFETKNDFTSFNKPNDSGRTIAGLVLLVIGGFFLMREMDFIPYWFTFRNFFKFMWPLVFIALGISIIAKSKRKNDWQAFQNQQQQHPTDEMKATTTVSNTDATTENISENENNSTPHNPQA